ncbi:MAG TPA: gliding motility-associated ABC transporter permease subunit GldF [Bacteroidales bacterium]|jgi:ABC-2 type transport system permease protein|nr:gliding motility-associated ABC transporter permease subunit GldF [Bacteroidales bacterium]
MWALFQKELSGFFSALTGYIVIAVFLTVNGLFLWVFPGNMNILDIGTSSLSPLFSMAPWVFLFLVPAITMRSFSEEKRSGTLDLLLTRPLSYFQIIMGKYLASVSVVILALVPVLVYYFSVIRLGSTPGNIDHGAFWGSFIGLFLLGAVYVAIGILASMLTDNSVVAFLLGVFLAFIFYSGFDYIANIFEYGGFGNFIQNLGIDAHYRSISRGIVDSRDLLYFFATIAIFIQLTRLKLASKHW